MILGSISRLPNGFYNSRHENFQRHVRENLFSIATQTFPSSPQAEWSVFIGQDWPQWVRCPWIEWMPGKWKWSLVFSIMGHELYPQQRRGENDSWQLAVFAFASNLHFWGNCPSQELGSLLKVTRLTFNSGAREISWELLLFYVVFLYYSVYSYSPKAASKGQNLLFKFSMSSNASLWDEVCEMNILLGLIKFVE
jgi:hypothetical protein